MGREVLSVLSPGWALVPLFAMSAIAVAAFFSWRRWRHRKDGIDVGALLWMGVFGLLALLLACFCLVGHCGASPAALAASSAMLALCGCLVPLRKAIPLTQNKRNAILLLLAAFFAFLGMEVAQGNSLFGMWLPYVLLDLALIALAFAALFYLCQRRAWLAALFAALLVFLGVAENYILRFRMGGLLPSDALAIGTAASVAGEYNYTFDSAIVVAIAVGALALLCLAATDSARDERLSRGAFAGVNFATSCVLAAVLALATLPWNYDSDLGFWMSYWLPQNTYKNTGMVVGFVTALQDYTVVRPDGYSDEHAVELIEQYARRYDKRASGDAGQSMASAQFEDMRPNVVAIMCEAYSDLSIYDQLGAGYEGTWISTQPSDALERGTVYVPALGGGTSNTEFEFLSGFSYAYLGGAGYPFLQYPFGNTETIAKNFADLGYQTNFIHPALRTSWHRSDVYTALDFTRQLYVEDFEGAERFHEYVSDGSTYDKAYDLIASSDGPQFIFDVTMQNHSGADLSSIAVQDRVVIEPEGLNLDEKQVDRLNLYLSCIANSDAALEGFLGRLEQLDEPVVVVFFGDHQPELSGVLSEDVFPDSDPLEEAARLYHTSYLIWANYDVDGRSDTQMGEMEAAFLGLRALELVGVPLSDWQKAELEIMQEMPVVGVQGTRDAQGNWVEYTDGFAAPQASNDLACILYYRYQNELR